MQRLPGGHGTIANVALTQRLPPEVAAAKDQQYKGYDVIDVWDRLGLQKVFFNSWKPSFKKINLIEPNENLF